MAAGSSCLHARVSTVTCPEWGGFGGAVPVSIHIPGWLAPDARSAGDQVLILKWWLLHDVGFVPVLHWCLSTPCDVRFRGCAGAGVESRKPEVPMPGSPSLEGAGGSCSVGDAMRCRPSLGCSSIAISLETMGREGWVNECLGQLRAALRGAGPSLPLPGAAFVPGHCWQGSKGAGALGQTITRLTTAASVPVGFHLSLS